MRRFIFAIFTLLSLSIHAQSDADARKILDKTAAVVNNKDGISAAFTISTSNAGSTNGKIYFKGTRFKAVTEDFIVWFNGKTQWAYMKQTDEVNITTPSKEQQAAMNPYTFINIYKEGYALKKKVVGTNYVVTLTATSKQKGIKEMTITINKQTYVPSQIKMLQDGTWTTIKISNFKQSKLPVSTFIFNKQECPDAEIVDLR